MHTLVSFQRKICAKQIVRNIRKSKKLAEEGPNSNVHMPPNLQGYLVFEDDATFEGNTSDVDGRDDRSKGGAIANTSDGTIIFKGKLTMVNNLAQVCGSTVDRRWVEHMYCIRRWA